MFRRPGRLRPRGRVHATFLPNIKGKTFSYMLGEDLEVTLEAIDHGPKSAAANGARGKLDKGEEEEE